MKKKVLQVCNIIIIESAGNKKKNAQLIKKILQPVGGGETLIPAPDSPKTHNFACRPQNKFEFCRIIIINFTTNNKHGVYFWLNRKFTPLTGK